jgi:uncharacterized coiled-coil protein SlyX
MHEFDDQSGSARQGSIQQPRTAEGMSNATERIQVIIDAAEKAAAGIIEDAEAQARRYLEESRRRAELITAERAQTIAELTDSLIAQAETVKRQSDGLIAALDDAKGKIEDRMVDAPAPAPPPLTQPPTLAPQASEPPPAMEPPLQAVESPEPEPPVSAVPPVAEAPPPPPEAPEVEPEEAQAPPPPPFAAPEPSVTEAEAPKSEGLEPVPESAKLLATQMAVAGSSRSEIESRLQSEYGISEAGQLLDSILGPEG